jgi:hypothetical protein
VRVGTGRLERILGWAICRRGLYVSSLSEFCRRASVDVESVSEDDNRFCTCQVGGDRSPTEEGVK